MTNLEMIRQKPIEYFAEIGIASHEEPDYDEGLDGEWEQCGTRVWYSSIYCESDLFWEDYDDVYQYNIKWLNRQANNQKG